MRHDVTCITSWLIYASHSMSHSNETCKWDISHIQIRHVDMWHDSPSGSVLQCVAVCCSVLQCVAVCCTCWYVTRLAYLWRNLRVPWLIHLRATWLRKDGSIVTSRLRLDSHRLFKCVAVCCSVLQCVAACCSVLQCVAVCCNVSSQAGYALILIDSSSVLQCVAACCSVLQRVAACCSAL